MNCKKIAALLAAAAISVALGGCGKTTIGYFNSGRVMNESPQLQAMLEEGRTKLQAVEAKYTELEKRRGELSEADFAREAQIVERELQNTQQEHVQKIRDKIDGILAEISKAKKLDAVVTTDNGRLIYHGGVDVTDEVISKLQ